MMAPPSKDVNKAGGGENIVHVNDVLCFLRARQNFVPIDDLVAITKATYGTDAAKEALKLYVSIQSQPAVTAPSGGVRVLSRRGAASDPETVLKTILRLMGEDDPHIPLFAAVDIDKIPPVSLRNIDGAHILAQNRDVRSEMASHSVAIAKIQQALDEVLSRVKAQRSCDCNTERISKIEMVISAMLAEKKSSSVAAGIHTPIENDLLTTAGPVSDRTLGTALAPKLHAAAQPPPPPPPSPLPALTSLPPPPSPPSALSLPARTPSLTPPPPPFEAGTSRGTGYSDVLRKGSPAREDTTSSKDDDEPLSSNQQGFTDVSALRKRNSKLKKNTNVKIGNGRTLQESFAANGTAKLFVSLPYPGSRYPLRRMTERVKRHLGEESSFKCKKRLSSKGNTSPFEIYGDANLLESVLFDENIWEERTCLQLVKKNVRLPKDYNQPDIESENDVKERVRVIQVNSRSRVRDPVQDSTAI